MRLNFNIKSITFEVSKKANSSMNIHEYQAKETLKSFGVQIQEGIVATTPEEAVKWYNEEFQANAKMPKF